MKKVFGGEITNFHYSPFVWTKDETDEWIKTGKTPRSVLWKEAMRKNPRLKWMCIKHGTESTQFFEEFPTSYAHQFDLIERRPDWLKTPTRELAEKIAGIIYRHDWKNTLDGLIDEIEKIMETNR